MKNVLASLILGLSLATPFSPGTAAPLQPPADADGGKATPTLADRDRNGLSDVLQRRLATLPPTEPVAVVVTLSVPGNAVAAQHSVGPFQVRREFRTINGFAATMSAGQAQALARVPGVFRVEEDFRVKTMLDAANADFGTAAARDTFAVTGSGVGICIVDTGVDPGHEQLDGGKVVDFFDFVNGRTAPYDDHGHGTHVAAIAAGDGTGGINAAALRGVAPGATVYAAKVLDLQGSGLESDVIAGVEWCVDPARSSNGSGVHIISLSLGSEASSDGSDALSQVVNSAVAIGKVAVVAAGNSGDGPESVGSPGAAAQAVTVGAAAEWSAPAAAPNHSDGAFLAWFSSRGPTADGRIKPDITAPGVSITSAQAGTASGYLTWSGTSMATPFVAGTVALALGNGNSTLDPPAVKNALMTTAQDRGPTGTDNDWGAGLLDGNAFVAVARNITADPTPFPTWQRLTGNVADGGVWTGEIEVTDAALPLAVTLTIAGQPECSLWLLPGWCWAYEWSPDLDAELIAPNGTTILRSSTCPAGSECGSMGRQETLHIIPPVLGTYLVRVYPFADAPNNGKGGSFALDVSTAPLEVTEPPPDPPVAGVASLLTGRYVTTGKGPNKVTTFVGTSNFVAGEEIVLRAFVRDGDGAAVPGAVVTLAIAGPEPGTLSSGPSTTTGMAEARWKTTAPVTKGRKIVPGTTSGGYTATVSNVSASGSNWDGTPMTVEFYIQ